MGQFSLMTDMMIGNKTNSNIETGLPEKERENIQGVGDFTHNINRITQSTEEISFLESYSNVFVSKNDALLEKPEIVSPSLRSSFPSGVKFNDKSGSFIEKLNNDNIITSDIFGRYTDHAKKILASGPLIIGEYHANPLAKAIIEQLIIDGKVKNLLLEQCDFTLLSQSDLNYLKILGNKDTQLLEKLQLRVKDCGLATFGEYYSHLSKYLSSKEDVAKKQQEEIVSFEKITSGKDKINPFHTLMKFAKTYDTNIHLIDFPPFLIFFWEVHHYRLNREEISKYVDIRNRHMAQVSRSIIENDPNSGSIILVGANHLYNDVSAELMSIEEHMGIANSQTFDVSPHSTLDKELKLKDSRSRLWDKKPYIRQHRMS